MKPEEEVMQLNFRNEYQKLAMNILSIHGWFINHQAAYLKKYGITVPQYNVLRILREQYPNPASINLLKHKMFDKMSDVSRLVERLKKKDLIDREICFEDKRRVEVVITKRGLKLLETIDMHEDEVNKQFYKISSNDAGTLNQLLYKIRE